MRKRSRGWGKELGLLEVDRPVGYDILEAEQTREGELRQ